MCNRKLNTTNMTKTDQACNNNTTLIISIIINLNSFYKSSYKDNIVGLDSQYKVTGNQTVKLNLQTEHGIKNKIFLFSALFLYYWLLPILALTAVLSRLYWPTSPTPLPSLATNLPPNSQADIVIITYNAVRSSTTKQYQR